MDVDGEGAVEIRAAEVIALLLLGAPLAAQDTSAVRAANDSVTVRFIDADIIIREKS